MKRKKEEFIPIDPSNVRMYVCGPTVYSRAHIGNARPVVVFDVLYRLLNSQYDSVTYVRNITDVDDKIIKASKDGKISIDELTETTIKRFHDDMDSLYAIRPKYEPRVTNNIDEIKDMIGILIEKGHAYISHNHVLFDLSSQRNHGKLSKKNLDDLKKAHRIEEAIYKKDQGDFVLWKPSIVGDPGWDSPWGYGRPGWHIECSAMAKRYLGVTFDIHGGGEDLIFPHHENEISQSESANNSEMAKYWVHNGFVRVNDEKMSKSIGNVITVRELLDEGWRGEEIRLSLLSAHYRHPLNFTTKLLETSRVTLNKWYSIIKSGPIITDINRDSYNEFMEAINDDLNFPNALMVMHKVSNLYDTSFERDKIRSTLYVIGGMLGIFNDIDIWFNNYIGEDEINRYIKERNIARDNKDWKKSDSIRSHLKDKGVVLEDSTSGTTWRYI